MSLRFEILGNPCPKQSVRFTKSGIKYQTKEVIQNADNIRSQIVTQLPPSFKIIDSPVKVATVYIFPPLKSFTKKMKKYIENGGLIIKSTKPDLDNLEKAINDAMQGVVIVNDALISRVVKGRYYGMTPKVIISITEITDIFVNKLN
ncbi:MAG: RusA family crossover junction endodeoxyribonuclease [Candidatus Kapabacteria bacterium]|nr:RusA family crossover junction endodeoxyribonuclease [Candidatus Kapabacteria bacterium]